MNKIISTAVTLLTALAMQARVSLPVYLSNNMVVQQQSTLTVSGHSDRGGQVRVSASWSRQAATAVATAAAQRGLRVLQTEWSMLDEPPTADAGFPAEGYDEATYMDIALYMAKVIHCDLVMAGASSWSYWTAFAQEQWGQKNRFYLLRVTANGDTGPESYGSLTNGGTIVDSRNLWVLGNYSRFIRPGYRRVELTGVSDLNGLRGSAYTTPDGNELVVVYVNLGPDFTGQEIAIPARSVVTVVMQLGPTTQPVAGDLNGDGMVDIDDVNAIVNIVLGVGA